MRHPWFVLSALLLLAPSLRSQACTLGPPTQLGTVTELPGPCPQGPPSLPRSTCRLLEVACDSLPPIQVEVRIIRPDPSVRFRGTVLLGTGGGGRGFYGERVGGPELVQALLGHGFRIVDRSWVEPWFGSSGISVRKQSCRYATLLTWVHDHVHTSGAFCATGNSGGSAEIGYALTTWGRGDILDVAVPTGGPPMSRLDLLCQNPITPQWQALCQALIPEGVMECGQPACTVQPGHQVCVSCSPNPTPADLEADSILHPAAVLDFPTTRVHQILGARDCGSAVPAGVLFHEAITSEKVLEWAPATPHWTATSPEGRAAIVRALLGGAACRDFPATLNAQAWPHVGGQLDLDVHGPAGRRYDVMLGFAEAQIEIPPFGWLFLHPPLFFVGAGTLDPISGRDTFTIPVPPEPFLTGLPVFEQAIAGRCLTNLARVEILP